MSDSPTSTPDADAIKRASANPLALVDTAFTPEQRAEISAFVGVPETHEAFRPFLAAAAHLGLSPILGEIWLIPSTRWDEDSQSETPTLRPAVGRDGFLKYAEEQENYGGLRSNTVCANDTFEWEDDGRDVTVVHKAASLGPTNAKEGDESRYRGPVVGAWAKVFFNDGRPPMFYYAPAHEHVRTHVVDGKVEPLGAWGYISAMSQKSAQSYVLRVGFRITGVVPIDELREGDVAKPSSGDGEGGVQVSIVDDPMVAIEQMMRGLEWKESNPDLYGQLYEALKAINELSPFSWSPSKFNLRLGNRTEEEAAKVLAEVEDEFGKLRARKADEEAKEGQVLRKLARDVQAPVDLRLDDAGEWVRIEGVRFDDEKGQMVFTHDEGKAELYFSPTDQVEIRTVPSEEAQPDAPDDGAAGGDSPGQ
jgi:hypothetical protein